MIRGSPIEKDHRAGGGLVFVRTAFYGPHDEKYELGPIIDGPFRLMPKTDTTVVVRIGEKQERVLWYKVVEAPPAVELLWKEMLQDEEDENLTKRAEDQATAEGGSTLEDEGYVIGWIVDHSN